VFSSLLATMASSRSTVCGPKNMEAWRALYAARDGIVDLTPISAGHPSYCLHGRRNRLGRTRSCTMIGLPEKPGLRDKTATTVEMMRPLDGGDPPRARMLIAITSEPAR
jgi:hypothetical protein